MWFGLKILRLSKKWSLSFKKMILRIISFQPRDFHSSPLFKRHDLLKFKDRIQLENVLLVSKYFNNFLPLIFDNWLTVWSDIHNYNASVSSTGNLFKPLFWTNLYGKNYITIDAVNAWSKMQTAFGDVILKWHLYVTPWCHNC